MNLYTSSFNKLLVGVALALIFLVEAFARLHYSPLTEKRHEIRAQIDRRNPDVIMLGGSPMDVDLDPELLQQKLSAFVKRGLQLYKVSTVHTLWYLVLKNEIAASHGKKGMPVILFFTDEELTAFRAGMTPFRKVHPLLGSDDYVFHKKFYGLDVKREDEGFSFRYLTYGQRGNIAKAILDQWLKRFFFFKDDSLSLKGELEKTFNIEKFQPQEPAGWGKGDRNSYKKDKTVLERERFRALVATSLLPNMIDEGRNFELVFVELPSAYSGESNVIKESRARYRRFLAEYLQERNAAFISIADDPLFSKSEVFFDPIHVRSQVKKATTNMVAEKLFKTGVFNRVNKKNSVRVDDAD